jgi:hypothetical protein
MRSNTRPRGATIDCLGMRFAKERCGPAASVEQQEERQHVSELWLRGTE